MGARREITQAAADQRMRDLGVMVNAGRPGARSTSRPDCYKPAEEVIRAVTDAGLAEVDDPPLADRVHQGQRLAGGGGLSQGGQEAGCWMLDRRARRYSPWPERPSRAGRRRDAVGKWKLNVEASDDAREKLRAAGGGHARAGRAWAAAGEWGTAADTGPAGWVAAAVAAGWAGRDGRAPRRRPGGRRRGPEGMRAILEGAQELTITQTEHEIAMLDVDGRLRALHPDGKGYKDSSGAEVKTRWRDARLVVETQAGTREGRGDLLGRPRAAAPGGEPDRFEGRRATR